MRRMFSENQIKSIAQQFGGTKLYKHQINVTYISGTIPTTPITVISFDSQPYNDDDLNIHLGDNALCIVDDDGTVYSSMVFYNGECEHRKINSEEQPTFNYNEFSDTVTPL